MVKELQKYPPVLTVEQAGEVLGISRWTAYQAAKRGDFPTINIGRRILVPRDALSRMLEGQADDEA
jgi:excisionase family DNA binding protein